MKKYFLYIDKKNGLVFNNEFKKENNAFLRHVLHLANVFS